MFFLFIIRDVNSWKIGKSYGFVCVILHLAVLVELGLVTDTWLVQRMHSIAR